MDQTVSTVSLCAERRTLERLPGLSGRGLLKQAGTNEEEEAAIEWDSRFTAEAQRTQRSGLQAGVRDTVVGAGPSGL